MSDLVTITGIAAGGDGVGRLSDGRAVFVPRTAPGDRIKLKDGSLKLSRNFGRAALAILATMVLLIVALTGILVETTWRNPQGTVETVPDPGSFARR